MPTTYKAEDIRTVASVLGKIILVIAVAELVAMAILFSVSLDTHSSLFWVLDVSILSLVSAPLIYWLAISPFVAERTRVEDQIRHLALHDPLTGLPNRRLVDEHLWQTLLECDRSRIFSAYLVIDLDDFKLINDTYGHAAGDRALEVASTAIQRGIRECDIAGRIGGDEFVLILKNVGSEIDDANRLSHAIASRVKQELTREFDWNGKTLKLSGSVGIRLIKPGDHSVTALIRDADAAMYQAKNEFKMGAPSAAAVH